MSATELDTGLLLHIEAIYNGDLRCATCGEEASLIVETEPDQEPGPACPLHAFEWIDLSVKLARDLYGKA